MGTRAPTVECYLVIVDAVVCGLAQFHDDGWPSGERTAGLDLILAESARGRGVGRAVVEQVVAKAIDRGFTRFTVDPTLSNSSGIAFWTATGFRQAAVAPEREGLGGYTLMVRLAQH